MNVRYSVEMHCLTPLKIYKRALCTKTPLQDGKKVSVRLRANGALLFFYAVPVISWDYTPHPLEHYCSEPSECMICIDARHRPYLFFPRNEFRAEIVDCALNSQEVADLLLPTLPDTLSRIIIHFRSMCPPPDLTRFKALKTMECECEMTVELAKAIPAHTLETISLRVFQASKELRDTMKTWSALKEVKIRGLTCTEMWDLMYLLPKRYHRICIRGSTKFPATLPAYAKRGWSMYEFDLSSSYCLDWQYINRLREEEQSLVALIGAFRKVPTVVFQSIWDFIYI